MYGNPFRVENLHGLHLFLGALAVLTLLVSGCGRDETGPRIMPDQEVRVVLPEYPYMDHSSIRVDPALLDRLAGRFLDQGGSRTDISAFQDPCSSQLERSAAPVILRVRVVGRVDLRQPDVRVDDADNRLPHGHKGRLAVEFGPARLLPCQLHRASGHLEHEPLYSCYT